MATATPLKRPGVWGIDLGQCALKAIRLESVDGQLVATAFDYIEHPKILSQPDADPDQLTREALDRFLERNDIKGDTVAISVPGQSGLARFVKLPPVDEKKIPDIVRFEAKQQIPFPLEEVVWAFQRLGAGVMTDNMVLDAEVGLFAMKRDMVNRSLQHFKDVAVEVHVIQMAPLALCNFLAHDLLGKGAATGDEEAGGEKSCIVALDIGADNSNLVITDGEKIIWQRPIPLGGNHFTRALTKDLKLTFAKAEHLKRNAVKSPDLKKILAALKPVLNDFVSEVQRSLGYFTNTHRDATIQYMMGLGNAFRLPGLQRYLQEKLQLEVRKLQKIERLEGEEAVLSAPQYGENVLSFAVAHGLALQGLKQTRLHTNLLPPEIAQERFIRAKKPWAVAAAAVLLLMSPPLMIGYAAAQRAWTNPNVGTATKKLKEVVDAANKDVQDYDKSIKEADESRQKVLAMAGGIRERANWLHLNAFIGEAIPRLDGSRLAESARSGVPAYERYYARQSDKDFKGKLAYEELKKLRERRAKGGTLTPEDLKLEEDIKKNLVQVHLEGFIALYSDNLPATYFAKLAEHLAKLAVKKDSYIGLSKEQAEAIRGTGKNPGAPAANLPKAGWVVEIRGYTYHGDTFTFVQNSIVENLVDLTDLDPANKRVKNVKLPPQTVKAFRVVENAGGKEIEKSSLVSFVLLYNYEVDDQPRPGAFKLISRSPLSELMSGGGAPGAKAAPPKAGEPEAPKVVDGKDRGAWHPPGGTLVAEAFQAGREAAGTKKGPAPVLGAGGGVAAKDGERKAPRTEFVIHFVWMEPLAGETMVQPGG